MPAGSRLDDLPDSVHIGIPFGVSAGYSVLSWRGFRMLFARRYRPYHLLSLGAHSDQRSNCAENESSLLYPNRDFSP